MWKVWNVLMLYTKIDTPVANLSLEIKEALLHFLKDIHESFSREAVDGDKLGSVCKQVQHSCTAM